MKNTYFLILNILLFSTLSTITAQEYISVSTENTCLIFKTNPEKKDIEQIYFGKKIKNPEEIKSADLPSYNAYSTFGTNHVFEAALRVIQSDGNTSTQLKYISHQTSSTSDPNIIQTVISLQDTYYDLFINIHFNAYQKENIFEQWVEIRNGQKKKIQLQNFASSDLSFHSQDYYVTHFHGDWADEMQLSEQHLTEGIKIIDSKLGVRTNHYTHPCFLLSLNRKAEEDFGEVIGGTLAWPGSFQFCFEVDNYNNLRVLSGANPYASNYFLEKGENFKTPSFLFSHSLNGTGEITRNFHRWGRKYGIHNGYGERSVLLNNWEATYFDFDEAKLTQIIDDAAQMGFELFLLDDGWFGNKYPRDNDKQGLGDWETNKKKLPNGISFLINECKKRNIKFGIWVEPEMVNPKSELFEKHPDWVITQPNRELLLNRSQLILDLSNPKVQEFVFNTVDRIISENPGIEYVKWDCNRFITNSGSQYLSPDKQSHLWIDNAKGILSVMDKVRQKHPDICMMLCSGGGGRIDYGSMKYFDEYWISDNGDPLQRLFIQWGSQYFFPTIGLDSHVSASPSHISQRSTPLKFRFDVAMSGKLGMDLQPSQMTPEEIIFSKNAINAYKQIRETVLHGDLYRLLSPYDSDRTAYMYVAENKQEAIVFNFLVRSKIYGDKQTILLKGLDPNKQYTISEVNKADENSRIPNYEGKAFSGNYLMTVGLTFSMNKEYDSIVFQLEGKD